jgi:hypothetical protein
MLSGCEHARQPACAVSPSDNAKIKGVVHAFYDALRQADEGSFRRQTTVSFYSYDGGKRYAGTELVKLVQDARSRGVQLNWSVGSLDTHIGCDMAWATWENVGSVGVPPQVQPVRWLESAVLVRQADEWRIDFFHSTRAASQ